MTPLAQRLLRHLRRWVTIRDRPSMAGSAAIALTCVAIILGLWYVLTLGAAEERAIGPLTLPSPGETFSSFPALWQDRAVARGAFWSLGRVMGGFVLGIAIAVPLGVLAASFRRLYSFVNPLSIFGRSIPIAALVPLTLIWFGLGEPQKIMFIFLASVAFIFFDAASAVDGVADSYLDSAYTLGARFVPRHGALWGLICGVGYALVAALAYGLLFPRPGEEDLAAIWDSHRIFVSVAAFAIGFVLWFPIFAFQTIRKVLLPLALPEIVNSLRLLFGLAFGYIMLAEMINATFGLGAIINTCQRLNHPGEIYLCLILITVLAFAIDRGILFLQHWLFPYRYQEGR